MSEGAPIVSPMFINHKLRIGDTVTISFTGDVSHEITGKLIGWDQHHVGL